MSRTKRPSPFCTPRLKVSPHLSVGAATVFRQIVDNVDLDHFSEVDRPLLDQYAEAAHMAQTAAAEIEKSGAVTDGRTSPWVAVLEKSSRACVALAARLRICPQSRFDRLVAGRSSRPQYKPPWDREGLLAGPVDENPFRKNGRRPKTGLASFR